MIKILAFKIVTALILVAMVGLATQAAWGAEEAAPQQEAETYTRTLADGAYTLTLTTRQGQEMHLMAKDRAGKVIFDGPVATTDQIARLPAAVATRFERLQKKLAVVEEKQAKAAQAAPASYRQLLEKKEYKDNPNILNLIAWAMVDPEVPFENPDLDVALTAALRANEIAKGNRSDILDTLARVYFIRGDVARAIEFQTLAVEKAAGPEKANASKTLSQYQAKQAEKKSTP